MKLAPSSYEGGFHAIFDKTNSNYARNIWKKKIR